MESTCTHNAMVEQPDDATHAWVCADCGYVYHAQDLAPILFGAVKIVAGRCQIATSLMTQADAVEAATLIEGEVVDGDTLRIWKRRMLEPAGSLRRG